MKNRNKLVLLGLAALAALILLPSHRRGSQFNADVPAGIDIASGDYADGVYAGSATGFQPGIEVEVEIREGVVERVSVVDHQEVGRQFWQRPVNLIPAAIVEAQYTDVDVVGGATSTSQGIMAAVEDALAKATL